RPARPSQGWRVVTPPRRGYTGADEPPRRARRRRGRRHAPLAQPRLRARHAGAGIAVRLHAAHRPRGDLRRPRVDRDAEPEPPLVVVLRGSRARGRRLRDRAARARLIRADQGLARPATPLAASSAASWFAIVLRFRP